MELILLLIIAAAIYYFFIYKKKQAKPKLAPKLSIENMQPGGVLHVMNIGPELAEYDVTIQARHRYEEEGVEWFELEGDNGSQKVWITIEEDDEQELSIVLKKIKLRDIGLTNAQLDKMDDQEEGEFNYNNQTFFYEDSGDASFFRNSGDKEEPFSYWEFENKDQTQAVSVEKWNDGTVDVCLSDYIKPSQVQVFSLGEA